MKGLRTRRFAELCWREVGAPARARISCRENSCSASNRVNVHVSGRIRGRSAVQLANVLLHEQYHTCEYSQDN